MLSACFLSAYVVDLAWLHGKLASVPRVVLSLDKSAQDDVKVVSWKGLEVVFPDFPSFPSYGVMHCKIMLLVYPQYLRFVIASANLMDYDYEFVQNVP